MNSATASDRLSHTGQPRRRILFVIGTMGAGGAERQILTYLQHLDRSRFEPGLLLDHRTGELLSELPADVRVSAFWNDAGRKFSLLWWLCKLRMPGWARRLHLARVTRHWRPDLIYERTFMATVLMSGPANRLKIPRIAAAVADPGPEVQRWFPRRQEAGYRLAKSAYATARRVVCNSQNLAGFLSDFFQLPPQLLVTVPNVIDFRRIPDPSSHKPPSAGSVCQLLCVGRIDREKGVLDLLTAVRQLVHDNHLSLKLHVLGAGPLLADLQSLVQEWKLGSVVEFHGFHPNPLEWMTKCDVFVFPSHSEGSPNALIEAMACGIPVIAADSPSGGPRELLENGRWGRLVPVQAPHELAAAIAELLSNLPQARQTAASAAHIIRERHDLARGVRRLEELFDDVLAAEADRQTY